MWGCFPAQEPSSPRSTKYWQKVIHTVIRHLKIDVYRGPQTSTGHVTRLQPRVYGNSPRFRRQEVGFRVSHLPQLLFA